MDIQQHPVRTPASLQKTTVLLPRDQILFLDELALQIRRKSGSALTRGGLIRALIGGLALSQISAPPARSERHCAEIIAAALFVGSSRR